MTIADGVGLLRAPERCPTVGCEGMGERATFGAFSVGIKCPDCLARDALEEMRRREEQQQAQLAKMVDRAALDVRMLDWSFDTYPTDPSARAASEYADRWMNAHLDGERTNLILWGPVGSGKTGLAWCVLRALIREEGRLLQQDDERVPRTFRMVSFRNVLGEMRGGYGGGKKPDMTWREAGVLVLDDLGAERPTDFARDELAQVVETRYTKRMPTIVTSNYDMAELIVRLGHDDPVVGKRIVSRLTEDAWQWHVDAPDRRSQAR